MYTHNIVQHCTTMHIVTYPGSNGVLHTDGRGVGEAVLGSNTNEERSPWSCATARSLAPESDLL